VGFVVQAVAGNQVLEQAQGFPSCLLIDLKEHQKDGESVVRECKRAESKSQLS